MLATLLLLSCAGSRPSEVARALPDACAQACDEASAAAGRPRPRSPPLVPVLPAAAPVRTVARVSIGAVGDVLIHGAVKDTAADHRAGDRDDGYGWLWAPVADLLAETDVTFANLESPVAPRSGQPARSFVFNTAPAAVSALRNAGVNVVSIANNHIFDQGRTGFEETIAELDRLGMRYVGAGAAGRESGPTIVDVNGIRIAFLAYSRFFNQDGNECPSTSAGPGGRCVRASLLDRERAIADVRSAAEMADAVVVSLHWGEEYQQEPLQADVVLAHRLADAGALLVLGHHPHVLQPLEIYQRADGTTALVAYSLGNFVSNQSRNYVPGVTPGEVAAARDGALVRAEIARRDYGRGVTRVELAAAGWLPLWTENDTADPSRRASARRPAIQVVSIDRALAEVRRELQALPDPVPAGGQPRYVALRRREELYLSRRSAIATVLGDDLRREAPIASVATARSARAAQTDGAQSGALRQAASPR